MGTGRSVIKIKFPFKALMTFTYLYKYTCSFFILLQVSVIHAEIPIPILFAKVLKYSSIKFLPLAFLSVIT